MSIAYSIERLKYLCKTLPPALEGVDDETFSSKPSPDKWSKKEILGHLIDSATNNHQRFIRIQYEHEPVVSYDQNKWNELNNYNQFSKSQLIQFWLMYNQHLVEVFNMIPEDNLCRLGTSKDGQKHTLRFYVEDYFTHLEHHLKQLIPY